MFGIHKQKEEIKKDIQELIEDGKLLSLGIMTVGCLTIGYILGATTTSTMYHAFNVCKKYI